MSANARKKRRGRHQSTCKDGRRTLDWLCRLPGVEGVTIGRTSGRASVGRARPVGHLKLQRQTEAGFRAVLQCSYGAQEVFIICAPQDADSVRAAIQERFP